MVRCGDVLWLFDGTAAGENKDRMFVCLEPTRGWFARIVTRQPRYRPVSLPESGHPFLRHDSYVETGMPVEFYEAEVDESERRGVAGRVSHTVAAAIVTAWSDARVTPPAAREEIVTRVRETYGL